jgi:hypothetical protein
MAEKHMKKCSPSRVIKEMQIKTTLRCHLTSIRIAIIKITTNHKYWKGCRERNPNTLPVGMQTSTTALENNMEAS